MISSFTLLLLATAIIAPLYHKADITEAATGTSATSTLTLNISSATANVDLLVNSSDGTFATSDSDNQAKFSVATTNYTGYTLSISASNNDGKLNNGSNYLNSIPSATATFNSTDYNGTWGYLPSKLNSSTNSKYQPSPTTTATTLDETGAPNSTANSYTIGIGARATYSQAFGTYSNTFTLTAVANRINYSITYNANAGNDTVSNLPSTQAGATTATSITLSSNTPTRSGYEFKGWCTAATSDASCSGTTYQPGDTYGIDQKTINTATFYAMWDELVYMQNLASSACTTTATTVTDSRDGTKYTIRRLADENCWLLDNLALDLTNPTVQANLTSATTNASDEALGYLINGGGSSPYPASGVSSAWTSSSQNSYVLPYMVKNGTCNTSGKYCVTNTAGGNWSYTDTTEKANDGADKYPGKVGIYYNYCAASAGSYCYSSAPANTNASYDICPKGWRLPTGGSSGEFQTLDGKYNDYANFRSALQVPLSGAFNNGVAFNQGSNGHFWSSTYNNANNMYVLYVNIFDNVYPASTYYRSYGLSIRCILDERIFMQDVDEDDLATLMPSTGDTATLYDKRDGTTYTIGHLADGNYWLLDNLALDLTDSTVQSKLTSATTNASDEALGYLINGGGSSPYPASGVSSAWTSSSQNSYNLPYMVKSGTCNASNKYCVTNTAGGSWSYASTTGQANDGADKYPGKVGIYYNYCAASAGSYCYSSAPANTNAQYDICPYGWRLPTGGSSGEFQALYTAYSSNYANFRSALQVPLSGTFYDGVANYQGLSGSFWSSTYYSAGSMYYLSVGTSIVYPASNLYRYFGFSVRCLFKKSVSDGMYMQDANSSTVANMEVGQTVTMIDNRDNTSYKVGKLADGNLWLLENLALDLTNNTVLNNMSASNTHATAAQLNYLKNGGGTTSNQYAITGVSIWTESSRYASLSSYSDPLYQMSGTCNTSNKYCVTNTAGGSWSYTSTTGSANDGADKYPGKVGAYYNYCAATAGTYCYGSGTSFGSPSGNASADICPYGWRLPTGGSSGEFQALYTAYSSNYANFRSALQVPLSGKFLNGVAYDQGYYGYFWSSTYYNANSMYYLYVNTSNVYPAYNGDRGYGFSVRCVLGS